MTTIIIGAGLAGLYVADGLLKSGIKGENILIIEKYGYVGGRVVSGKRPDGTVYEIGAGRFHKSHTKLIQLIRRFGLSHIMKPIDDTTLWKSSDTIQQNLFQDLWAAYLPIFRSLPKDILANSTLKDISIKIFGKKRAESFFIMHPYRSEIEILRADLALESDIFLSSGYFYLEGGLTQIIDKFMEYLAKKGVRLQTDTPVMDIRRDGSIYSVVTQTHDPLQAIRVIAALHVNALRSLPVFKSCNLLKHIQMAPLTRIYAQFPIPWPVPRVVTDSLLRYCIPIDSKKGLVMISYTDARDTVPWKGLHGPSLQKKIVSEIRRTFPDISMQKPSWVKSYEWKDGCSYWVPGDYDPRKVSQDILCPLAAYPELYVCGESFSLKQTWMEGALEHAAHLISRIQLQTTNVNPAV
jgi:monoamine oxidase